MELLDRRPPNSRLLRFLFSIHGAFIVCAALLAIMVLPPVYRTVSQWDLAAAYRLNGIIGHSPVFDRLITFVADEDGRERLFGIVLIYCIAYVWRARTRTERAQRLAAVIFLSVTIIGAMLTEKLLDECYARRSPSYIIRPFRNVHHIYEWEIDVRDHRSFPSSEGMVLLLAAFLLIRMRAHYACVFLCSGLVLPIGGCIVGRTWLSDVYLGALPISYLLSTVIMGTPLRNLELVLFTRSLAFLDHSHIYWRRYRHLLRPWRIRGSRNSIPVEIAVKQYLSSDLPMALGLPAEKPERVEMPLSGRRTLVRFVTIGDRKLLVRAYPVGTHHEAEMHAMAAQLLLDHGVSVPRVLHYGDQPAYNNVVFVTEEFIEGHAKQGDALTMSEVDELATQVRKLHAIKNDRWGPLLAPRSEDYATVLLRRADRRIDKLLQEELLETTEEARGVREWFQARISDLRAVREFSLTHGQLHGDNGLFTPDGRFVLLDYATLLYAVPQVDLVYVHHQMLESKPELVQRFNEVYTAGMNDHERHQFERLLTLFYGLHYLSRANSRMKRSRRRGIDKGEADDYFSGTHHLRKLLELIATGDLITAATH